MLSGRSTVMAAEGDEDVESVLGFCCERLALADDGSTLELWHGQDIVPHDRTAPVRDWPGVQPKGSISEYQLV
eukprot:3419170-Amphidinium_carterae.1